MTTTTRQRVARNIRHLKRQQDLTWAEIAEQIGVKERQVYRWADDSGVKPSDGNLERLAELFGVTPGYLLDDNRESRRA